MNKRQLEVQKANATEEQKVIRQLKQVYNQAKKDCEAKIAELNSRTDMQNLQAIVYQKQYQEALKKQIEGILNNLQSNQFNTIAEYLGTSYENGFLGTLYDLQGQGIPLIFPIDQSQVVQALQTDSKISTGMYNRLGEDVTYLKKSIKAELSRGAANGSSWLEIATKIANGMNSPFGKALNNALRIARTEGHRVQQTAQWNTLQTAKAKGADVVKQWDSTLDDRTRTSHKTLDGQIRELDEYFEVNGHRAMFPGSFGVAGEDIHCRCCMLQRARWALDEDELHTLEERAAYFGLDKSENFQEFKDKYLKLPENADTMDMSNNGYYPDTIAGVQRGSEMTFEEADTFRVNPNYGVNGSYSINCQSCVVTFEARQRGYDVQVVGNTKGSTCERLSYKTNLAWIDPKTGKNPEYSYDNAATTPKKYLSYLQGLIKQDERYTIEFSWKGRSRSGHIVNLDRNESGQLRIKDNQRGKGEKNEWIGDNEVLTYLSRMKYTTSIYGHKFSTVPKVLRIDNMEFDPDVVNDIMEGVK